MNRKALTTATLILVAITASPFAPYFTSHADEGMWLPNTLDKLPLAQLKRRGFELKPDEVYSTTKPSLKDAIVQISAGGTGSFVSPDGLILTNHHIAFSAVTRASSAEKDYINKGFLAKTRAEEIAAQGYTISILQDFKEVTAEVTSALKPETTPDERQRVLATKQQEIAKLAAAGREKDGIRTQVVEASGGYQYYLYTYLTLKDVRLVYAPQRAIGYFGGDPDNFEWPRHCGDFAFLRAYTGADGKPAAFSKENVPFKPKRFLAINPTGIKEGDFAMVMGHPGATYRHRESYSVEYRQHIQLPLQIAGLRKQIKRLTKVSEKSPPLRIQLADTIFSLSNSLKALEGTVAGLRRMNLVTKKRAEETELRKWIENNAAAKAKYGDVLPQLESLYVELSSISGKQNALTALLDSGDLLNALQFAYGRALDREKPANERAQLFSDQFLPQVTAQLSSGWDYRQPSDEAESLAAALVELAGLPANSQVAAIEQLFAGKTGDERRKAEAELARQALESAKFTSFDDVKKLFDASAAQLRAMDHPALKLAIVAYDTRVPLEQKQTQILNQVTKVRPRYVAAIQELRLATKGAPYYPDANFTLRFTYGDVKSYKPRDAVTYDFQTSLSGVLEKDTGEEPFDVPASLKALAKKRDFGGYLEPRLNDVPVDFLATTDITGGNSGSPIMNGRGELIGLVFDGNYEGLGGDYSYDMSVNRTLSVDIRYVLFLTEKLGDAGYLFNEMQIRRGKAMAASR